MTGTRIYLVHCDGVDCPLVGMEATDGEGSMCRGPKTTLTEYRNVLHADGWRHIKGKDYCPDCVALMEAEVEAGIGRATGNS